MMLTSKRVRPIFCSFLKFGHTILVKSFDVKFLKPLVLIDLFIMNVRM